MVDAELAGMASYLVISLGVVAVFSLWLTVFYARAGTHWGVIFSTWFSWYFTFISVWILLPLDLLGHARDFFYHIWQIVYWLSFVNTWIILPVHQTYAEAGEFTVMSRLWASIKFNIKFYVIAGILLVAFIAYIAIENQFSQDQLVGFIVCVANTWGLSLGILLLGYGLVEVSTLPAVHSSCACGMRSTSSCFPGSSTTVAQRQHPAAAAQGAVSSSKRERGARVSALILQGGLAS